MDPASRKLLDQKEDRRMLTRPKQRGVTLIELMIGIALLALLIIMGVPTFGAWMTNMRVRNAAEGILNGMQLARAEAIHRNKTVQIVIAANSSWTVSVPTTGDPVQARDALEGATGTALTFTPAAATTLTFNGMGWVTTNNDASASITQIDVTKSGTVGPEVRPLRIVVGTGGAMKMCDPQVPASDTRACP